MTFGRVLAVAAAIASSAVPAAAAVSPLDPAFNALEHGDAPRARALALAFEAANGAQFPTAFILARAACLARPHSAANAAGFDALRRFPITPTVWSEVLVFRRQCISPAPPPPRAPQGNIGVSTAGLSVEPSMQAIKRVPVTVAPPRVIAQPSVGPVRPAACRALDQVKQRPSPPANVVATLTEQCNRLSQPAQSVVAAVTPPPLAPADACADGYVWREAFAGAHVCAVPATRTAAAADNAAAASRVDPAGAYGPATCIAGYVWREARTGDLVCVVPERRSQAKTDNAQAAQRLAR